ncbi:MAG TPA: hypothetical protein PKM25_11490, partial [Candidatus Ozemobacteraceae bacterium]|nr:hypothetical protein [Candidatus Ozemobacteraceae bacterium]
MKIRLRTMIPLFLLLGFLATWSQEAFAQALPPISVRLKSTATGNHLVWEDGGNDGATTLTYYEIGRSLTRGGPYTDIFTGTQQLSYDDSTAVTGTTYYYAIRDVNSGGTSGWSEEVERFWPLDGATADVQTYKTEFTVWTRWPMYDDEIVKTYVGLSTVPGEDNVKPFVDVGHATEYTFTNLSLQAGITYYVTVKILNATGYLAGYGTSICSSDGFTVDTTPSFADDTDTAFFNNSLARVMTQINANDVTAVNFADGAIRQYRVPVTITEPGIESRFNAPMEITVGGTGFPTTLAAAQQQVRVADEWGDEVPCRVTSNGITPITQDLYNAGTESVPFSDTLGYALGTYVTQRQAAELYLSANTANSHCTWVTQDPIDLTGWDEVVINWSNTGVNNAANESYFIVSSVQDGNHTVQDARLARTGTFGATTQSLAVTGFTGNYYIRVHARRPTTRTSTVNIFQIYLRKNVYQSAMTLIGNLPKSQSRDYWVSWGGGTVAPAAFPSSSNDTSQRAWSIYYSRKLLPPGIENYDLSVFTKLAVTGD